VWAIGLLLLIGLMIPAGAFAEDSNHNAAFLRAGVDARYFGMGGTGVAFADDASAAYWNPAGLANHLGFFLTGMYTGGMDFDRTHNYLGVSHGWENWALGFGWNNAGTDDITKTTGTGTNGELFKFSENAFMLSAAYYAGPFTIGVTPKYLIQDLGTSPLESSSEDNVSGFSMDWGAQFAVTEELKLGMAMQDLFGEVGGNRDDDNSSDQIPTNMRLGAAAMPYEGLTVAVDLEKEQDEDWRPHFGGEFWHALSDDFDGAVRLGADDGNFSAGLGIGVSDFIFNYAYVNEPEGLFTENHRFSVNYQAGHKRGAFRGYGDRDGDGIADADDDCPDDPEDFDGFEDMDGCPEYDNDGDGIPDGDDGCPNQAEDFDGYMDEDGCPDLDNDGDGILDVNDNCPNDAEVYNGFEDSDGCPDDAPIYFPIAHINFKFNTAEITSADPIPVLDEVVRIMNENPSIRVEIQGHTDSVGDDAYNTKLSGRRAQAIKDYLVRRGVDAGRLETRGFGESRPIDTNDTELGRARNRRVEFVVIK
jgi:outer membrane protein OmpA-like peptidoglycan-associated protein